jgi:hypothetical protein
MVAGGQHEKAALSFGPGLPARWPNPPAQLGSAPASVAQAGQPFTPLFPKTQKVIIGKFRGDYIFWQFAAYG